MGTGLPGSPTGRLCPLRRLTVSALLLVNLMSSPLPTPAALPITDAAASDWSAWRDARAKALLREDGWLALVGLHWLSEGDNRVDGLLGTWVLRQGTVRLEGNPADGWTLDGQPVPSRELTTDLRGAADRLKHGTNQLQVIERGGKLALRVWDAASSARASFKGIDTFPYQARWRIVAAFEPFATPKEVETPSMVNLPQKELVPGRVRFELDGKGYTLEPTREKGSAKLSFVFRDRTAPEETYGAGRFLSADAPVDGMVVLDFNRAYNPPCAFTPHATCPLPRPENVLAVRIEAGEKRVDGH